MLQAPCLTGGQVGGEQTQGTSPKEGAWRAAVHGVTKSQTQMSDWTELNDKCLLEQVKSFLVISGSVHEKVIRGSN